MKNQIDVDDEYVKNPQYNFIQNWIEKRKKKNPYYFPTAFAIIFSIVFIVTHSSGFGDFFHNVLEMFLGSMLVCAVGFIIFMSHIKDDQVLNVGYLLWAVIAMMGVYGGFWVF